MHGNFKGGRVNAENSAVGNPMATVDPIDVVMRLARDLRDQGVKVVVLGNIQLEFFEPKSTEVEMEINGRQTRIADLRDNAKNEPIDLDTYHLE